MNASRQWLTQSPLIPYSVSVTHPPHTDSDVIASVDSKRHTKWDEQREPGEHAWRVGVTDGGEGHILVQYTVEVASKAVYGHGLGHLKGQSTEAFVVVRHLANLRIGVHELQYMLKEMRAKMEIYTLNRGLAWLGTYTL